MLNSKNAENIESSKKEGQILFVSDASHGASKEALKGEFIKELANAQKGEAISGHLIFDENSDFGRMFKAYLEQGSFLFRITAVVPIDKGMATDSQEGSGKYSPLETIESESPLSERETEILELMAYGHRRSKIAQKLSISVFTYDTHRRNIRRKLGAHSLGEMIRVAREMGLLD